MREIKFRAWDKIRNKMLYPLDKVFHLATIINFPIEFNPSYGIPLQYTGLKDKNGKEIYEGDIVNFKQGKYYHYGATGGTVEYLEGGFYPFADNEDNMPYPKPEECEVIGNIYENPELN